MTKVFVYGTLKTGYPLNWVLVEGRGKLLESEAILHGAILLDLGKFPAAIDTGDDTSDYQVVHGEIWEVNSKLLKELDRIEGVPTFYQRVAKDVAVGDELMDVQVYMLPSITTGRWEKKK